MWKKAQSCAWPPRLERRLSQQPCEEEEGTGQQKGNLKGNSRKGLSKDSELASAMDLTGCTFFFFFKLSGSTLREFSWPWKFEWEEAKTKQWANLVVKVFVNILVKRPNQKKAFSRRTIETRLRQVAVCVVFNRSVSIRLGFISSPPTASIGQVSSKQLILQCRPDTHSYITDTWMYECKVVW